MSTPSPPPPPLGPDGRPRVRTIGDPGPQAPPPGRPFTRWWLVPSITFAVIGFVWTAVVLAQSSAEEDYADWPNTLAMVISCQKDAVTSERPEPHNRITFRYDVEGRRYEGDSVVPGPCVDYALGKGVRVSYPSWQPRNAILTPDEQRERELPTQLVASVLCMLTGLGLGAVQIILLTQPQWARFRD